MHLDLGPANHHAEVCISRIRWLPPALREILQKQGLWEDLMQELYTAAFSAWEQGMDNAETRRYAVRCLYAFLKSYGFRPYRRGFYRLERPLFSLYDFNQGIPDKNVTPHQFSFGTDHFEDKILDLLKKHPEGLPRRKVCSCFQIPIHEASMYLAYLIKKGLVVEIKRENTRGRPLTSLLVVPEPGQVLPEPKMVKSAQTERIKHAYFVEGKSIKGIAREFHHDRRTVRRAIKAVEPSKF